MLLLLAQAIAGPLTLGETSDGGVATPGSGHAHTVVDAVRVGPDRVASLDEGGVVVLWDAGSGDALQRWTGVPGTHLASWSDRAVLFYSPEATGRLGDREVGSPHQ